jgi:hypothetical protein
MDKIKAEDLSIQELQNKISSLQAVLDQKISKKRFLEACQDSVVDAIPSKQVKVNKEEEWVGYRFISLLVDL